MRNQTYSKLLLLAVTSFLAVGCGSEHVDPEPIEQQPIDQDKIAEWSSSATSKLFEGNALEALTYVDSLLKYKPNESYYHYLKGEALTRLEEYPAAEESLFKSISLPSEKDWRSACYSFLSEISSFRGDTAAVLEYLDLQFEISNDSSLYYTHLTLAYFNMDAFEAAIIPAKNLVRINTIMPAMAYRYLVIAYYESGDTAACCQIGAEMKMLSYENDPFFDEICATRKE
jgi:tetratricopeptide (TPR) repeat protein